MRISDWSSDVCSSDLPAGDPSLARRLTDDALLAPVALVGGVHERSAASARRFVVTNPSGGGELATLPDCGVAEARRAIDAAYSAQGAWAARTGKDRAAVLRRLYDLMRAHAADLAPILTAEMGQPYAETG